MFALGSKTPVSQLQEHLVLLHLTPRYEVTRCDVGTHNPRFVVRVTSGQRSAEGEGRSKQEAKHKAAYKMLVQLGLAVPTGPIIEETEQMENDSEAATFTENYVGMLKEYCTNEHYPEPKYCLEEEAGPPHSKIFKMVCCVSQLRDFGIDKTKKMAKQKAAHKLLQRLKDGKDNREISFDEVIVEVPKFVKKIPEVSLTDEEVVDKYIAIKNATYKEPAVYYKDYQRAYVGIQEQSPTLEELLNTGLKKYISCSNSIRVITKVAQELEVRLTYSRYKGKDPKVCPLVMTMSLVPPIASIGFSEEEAANNLLNSLVLLCSY